MFKKISIKLFALGVLLIPSISSCVTPIPGSLGQSDINTEISTIINIDSSVKLVAESKEFNHSEDGNTVGFSFKLYRLTQDDKENGYILDATSAYIPSSANGGDLKADLAAFQIIASEYKDAATNKESGKLEYKDSFPISSPVETVSFNKDIPFRSYEDELLAKSSKDFNGYTINNLTKQNYSVYVDKSGLSFSQNPHISSQSDPEFYKNERSWVLRFTGNTVRSSTYSMHNYLLFTKARNKNYEFEDTMNLTFKMSFDTSKVNKINSTQELDKEWKFTLGVDNNKNIELFK